MVGLALLLAVHTISGKPNSLHDTEEGEEDSKFGSVHDNFRPTERLLN